MAGFATPVMAALSIAQTGLQTADAVRGTVRRIRGRDDATAAQEQAEELLAARQAADLADLRARQDLETDTLGRELQGQADLLAATAQEGERRRLSALRRSVARTRAQLGGQGISAADGSGEAILLGLVQESEAERRAAGEIDRLRLAALNDRAQASHARNLLDVSRLQERQRLERLARGVG